VAEVTTELSVCILAGGKGGRIGGEKCMRRLAGKRLIDHALGIAREVREKRASGRIVIAGGRNDVKIEGVETLPDVMGAGPMAGLYSCLSQHGRTLLLPCDMPFLTSAFLLFLLEQSRNHDITTCRVESLLQPHVGVYSQACLEKVRRFLEEGTYSLFLLVREGGLRVRMVEEEEIAAFGDPRRLFFNINTKRDMELGERMAGRVSDS
jgi:molybdopterin-guanine dinucleotide biosynthesis protein A